MLDPTSLRIIYEQKERELMAAIESKRRLAEAEAIPFPVPYRPWYVRLMEKLPRLQAKRRAAEPSEPCCDPC